MSAGDAELAGEAYRILSDVLVNFRHILLRALIKKNGPKWFEDTALDQVRQRLIEHKEHEATIDRFALGYEELIDFSDFADIADIVSGSGNIAPMLKKLVSSPELLQDRFAELERLRRMIAVCVTLDDADFSRLTELRDGFGLFLKGAAGAVPPWDSEPPAAQNDQEEPEAPDSPDQAVEVEPAPSQEPPVEEPAPDDQDVPVEDSPEEPPSAEVPAPELATQPIETVPPEAEWFGVDQALLNGDDHGVLSALHQEVMALAQGFFGEADNRPLAVWVASTSWFAEHREALGLEGLERFYALVEEHRRRAASGTSKEELSAFVTDSGLPELLMSLREIFLANTENDS